MMQETAVPFPNTLSIVNMPPSKAARSCIEFTPYPRRSVIHIKAAAIIGDGQRDLVAGVVQNNIYLFGLTVPGNIGQRFPRDSE